MVVNNPQRPQPEQPQQEQQQDQQKWPQPQETLEVADQSLNMDNVAVTDGPVEHPV